MFSVILPSYNHSRFLRECVVSAVRSTLVNEVIIVDDGSTDGSTQLLPVIEQMSPKIKLLYGKSGNLGAHNRLNELVEASTNRWIAVLNTDDIFVSGRFDAISRVARQSRFELFFGDLILIDGEGKRIGFRNSLYDNEVAWPNGFDFQSLASCGDWIPMLAKQNLAATTTNMIFTRELYNDIGGFRSYRYCHDWDFILRAATLPGRVAYSPTMLSKYRIHSGNTIKEDKFGVVVDVRKMFSAFRRDFPRMFSDEQVRKMFEGNPYLSRTRGTLLNLVVQDDLGRNRLVNTIGSADLPFAVSSSAASGTKALYNCELDPAISRQIKLQHLLAFYLILSLRSYDAILVSIGSAGQDFYPEIDRQRQLIVWNAEVEHGSTTNVRRVHLDGAEVKDQPPGSSCSFPEQFDSARCDGAPGPWPAPNLMFLKSPLLEVPALPTIFVFPAFLAVGGVERLVLDTINLHKGHYNFVIINTEILRPEQGSMHAEFKDILVFDLPELARRIDYLRAVGLLRTMFEPDLVWFCNGSTWQVENAQHLRELFSDIPIVDQVAYDHNAGWINTYEIESVKMADRFIAINNKIRETMQAKFGIPGAKIDLIYHGADLGRVPGPSKLEDEKGRFKSVLGFDPESPLFGMIGRLTAQKRPLDMIELAKNSPNDNFLWVGLGEMETEFLHRSSTLKNIRLMPAQKDLIPIYKALDGMIIFSEYEGLPLVMLEALAMGIPVLSSDVGAIKEVIDRYESGCCYSTPGNMSELLKAFNSFKVNLSSFAGAARINVELVKSDFGNERMASDYKDSFERAILEKRGLA